MKERPILFNSEMVKAILNGTKTQTRRVLKSKPIGSFPKGDVLYDCGKLGNWLLDINFARMGISELCPYGKVGDQLVPAMEIPSLGKNYCADIFGRIWSRARNKKTWVVLSGSSNSKGYLTVTPSLNGKYKTKLAHRLVAEAFYGFEPNGYKQVRHLDGNQINNSPLNLDWGTQEQNWTDRLLHGKSLGEKHHASKLTKENVVAIRDSNKSQRILAKEFNVSQSLIQLIKANGVWKENVTQDAPNMPRWASRIQLEITNIRVERLNDISDDDARAEGVKHVIDKVTGYCGYDYKHGGYNTMTTPYHGFRSLWESINGAGSWALNPFVWCVEFKVIKS